MSYNLIATDGAYRSASEPMLAGVKRSPKGVGAKLRVAKPSPVARMSFMGHMVNNETNKSTQI